MPQSLSDEIGTELLAAGMNDPRLKHSRHIVFNLTRPEKSLILLAPLAQRPGGYGLCQPADAPAGAGESVIHRTIPATDAAGDVRGRQAAARRRSSGSTCPASAPRPEYVREMKRYGVLPEAFDPARDPFDPYAIDRIYWESLWHRPP